MRAIERQAEDRADPEADIVLGYCAAVRGALGDGGQPPLRPGGLLLRERLGAIEASLDRAAPKVAQGWLEEAAAILANPDGTDSAGVRTRYDRLLTDIRDEASPTLPPAADGRAIHQGHGQLRRADLRLLRRAGLAPHRQRPHGQPDIVNTDQGSQFTSGEFIKALTDRNIRISMGGKGSWRDNAFVERLWRTVKYEEVYLKAYDSVREARESIGRYLDFYNTRRPHSSLDSQTPDEVYFKSRPALPRAA
ncbi:Integrase core domain-containing protein [Methylomagnum ishizawai]|uniref:Integrase core domain-containing protein n=1 Tax=Methylomagnum ishizawai TaxID=1760988 RepID=A0A1Y6DA75_9GAMM|nr:Integrase core domain-containing protein [Methylomagnum ishizawai]